MAIASVVVVNLADKGAYLWASKHYMYKRMMAASSGEFIAQWSDEVQDWCEVVGGEGYCFFVTWRGKEVELESAEALLDWAKKNMQRCPFLRSKSGAYLI